MKKLLIGIGCILFNGVNLNSQIPFPDGKPTFNNLPPFTSSNWDKNGNINSGIYPFNLEYQSFVSLGPAARNYNPIPALGIN